MSTLAQFLVGILLFAGLGIAAFVGNSVLSSFKDDDRGFIGETNKCLSPDCLTVEQVEALVGFRPVEPRSMPDGYVLVRRTVPESEIPHEARERIAEARGVPLDEVPETAPPNSVILEYRFQGRHNVPAILMVHTRDGESEKVDLKLASPECGDELEVAGRHVFYGEGLGSVLPDEQPGEWLACPNEGDAFMGNAVFLHQDNVSVELKASREFFTREDILEIVSSMF